MKLSFVSASKLDIDCIFSFNKGLIDRYENIQEIKYKKVLTWVEKKIKNNIGEYVVIFCENQKAGYYRFYQTDGRMELDDLYIFPQFQNRGIGTIVLKKCLSETNLPVFLYVFAENKIAVSLYTKFGFNVIEKINDNRYIMQRD